MAYDLYYFNDKNENGQKDSDEALLPIDYTSERDISIWAITEDDLSYFNSAARADVIDFKWGQLLFDTFTLDTTFKDAEVAEVFENGAQKM